MLVYKTGLHYDGLRRILYDEPCRFRDQTPGDVTSPADHASDIVANDGMGYLNGSTLMDGNDYYRPNNGKQALLASIPAPLHQTASEVNCQIKKSPIEIEILGKYKPIKIIS